MLHFPTTHLCIGLCSHSLLLVSKASTSSGHWGEVVPAHQHLLCGAELLFACCAAPDACVCVCGVQSSAVATQTARVQQLQTQAATGKVSVARLEKEQSVLSKMTVSHTHDMTHLYVAALIAWELCITWSQVRSLRVMFWRQMQQWGPRSTCTSNCGRGVGSSCHASSV